MVWPELIDSKILLVDDDVDMLALMRRALKAGGCTDLRLTQDAKEGIESFKQDRPDLVILDFKIPGSSGIEIMTHMHAINTSVRRCPVLILTGNQSEELKREALEAGASDFLHKNADMTELVLRVKNLLGLQQLLKEVDRQRESLEEMVQIRTEQLQEARFEVLERLARASEYRDDETGEHTRRVGDLSAAIALQMGTSNEFAKLLGFAALLHDIGKIGIPDNILLKPGRLTPEERIVIERHPSIGQEILKGSKEPLLRMAEEIAMTHHERWDGSGYPHGLSGSGIPLCGRIVAVADTYDALVNKRPYKPAATHSEACNLILSESGLHFDPLVVKAFLLVAESLSQTSHEQRVAG